MMLRLEVLCIFLSITQTSEAAKSEGIACETDYWLTIKCSLNSTAILNRTEHTSYWLKFRFREIINNTKKNYNCSLTEKEDGYTCTFKALDFFLKTFTTMVHFEINLFHQENGLDKSLVLDPKFYPAKHIRPINPHNFTINVADESYNFTWISGYEKHTYINSLPLRYKFFYHVYDKELQPDKVTSLQYDKTECSIPNHSLKPGFRYVAWVCTEILSTGKYKGVGSSCSPKINWITIQTEKLTLPIDPTSALLQSTAGIVTLICLGAMALIFMLLCPAARMKIKNISWVATPYPFFQPLFQNHQGNFKDWVSTGEVQPTYSEEILKIDMVTESSAEEKGPLNFCSIYSSEHYHTPYVSPATEVWAPIQMTESVGSISCKDLDFPPEDPAAEEPVVLCLTEFEPITVINFLCMDDLEFSQEDLEPPEPETTTLRPAAFPQSYCTLTNTPSGLVPTLTTRPCSPKLEAEASEDALNLQTEENTEELIPPTLDSLQLSMD